MKPIKTFRNFNAVKPFCLLLLVIVFSVSVKAQIIPFDPPIDEPPFDELLVLELDATYIETLRYNPAQVGSDAEAFIFAVDFPMRITLSLSNFSYSGYGSTPPAGNLSLNFSFHTINGGGRSGRIATPTLNQTTGVISSYFQPDTITIFPGTYEFRFQGYSTGTSPHSGDSPGILPMNTIISGPQYSIQMMLSTFDIPFDPYEEIPPQPVESPVPNLLTSGLTSLRPDFVVTETENCIITFLSQDGNMLKDTHTHQSPIFVDTLTGNISVTYYDDLGREEEGVFYKFTPEENDLVTYQSYDALGRKSDSWLPASMTSSATASYRTPATVFAAAIESNNEDEAPYSTTVYEESPLNRLTAQFGAGEAWRTQGRAIRNAYLTNILEDDTLNCLRFTTYTPNLLSANRIGVRLEGNYATGSLRVIHTCGEDGETLLTFIDRSDRTVLTRNIKRTGSIKQLLDTYYIYDGLGHLCAVLPPLACEGATVGNLSTETLDKYAYLYEYDEYERINGKKLPGCEWEDMIYDGRDRVVLSRNGEEREAGKWSFFIYDMFDRLCLSGTCTNYAFWALPASPNFMWQIEAQRAKCAYTGENNVYKGYKVYGVDLTNPVLHTVHYYDRYDFLSLPSFSNVQSSLQYETPESGYGVKYASPKGLLTGSITAQLDGAVTPNYLYSTFYYDDRNRVVQSKSTNSVGGVEKEFTAYNFRSLPVKRKHIHTKGSSTQSEEYAYTYDHADRLLTTTHKLNSGSVVTLADNEYDELGRLKSNSRNGVAALKCNYTYNVRSWMKTQTGSLFNQTLYYNDVYAGSTPQYNGNISAMTWRGNETLLRGYTFSYDNLSRLTAANYKENGVSNTNYGTSYTYDKHGNITALQRRGRTGTSTFGVVDNLTMTYNGNQLTKTEDAVSSNTPSLSNNISPDFKNWSTAQTEYTYDSNGNQISDLNKGVSAITYNVLNLPRSVTISNPTGIAINTYTYSSDGVLRKAVRGTKTTDYCGNFIYENNVLKRILIDGGYIENGVYYFYLQDHLGNNRVVANASGTAVQVTHYYPYGMPFGENTNPDVQPYKFGGKEFDTERSLNWSDFLARQYGNDVPRFTTVDLLAEKYYGISPYAYCMGNPIRYIDPTGKDIVISGALGDEALKQLQARAGNSITLSMGDDGKVSYTTNTDKKLRGDAKRVAGMISDNSITVNLITTDKNETSTGNLMIGGAFMGNTVKTDANGNVTVDAKQEVNPNVLGKADAGNTGKMMMHEATEAYQGAKISQKTGVSSPRANTAGSVYQEAHNKATPQSTVYQKMYDKYGNETKNVNQAVKVEWHVLDRGKEIIIQRYP